MSLFIVGQFGSLASTVNKLFIHIVFSSHCIYTFNITINLSEGSDKE